MNAPLHFKEQLADELSIRAASLPVSADNCSPTRRRSPRRQVAFTAGATAALAVVVIALPLLSGTHHTPQAAPAPRTTLSTGPGTSTPPTPHGTPGTGLDIVNADYSLKSEPDGKVAVQLFKRKGVPGLQAALRKAGVPAAVMTPSASCHATFHSDHSRLRSLDKILPQDDVKRNSRGIYHVINPAAIPEGDHLLFIVTFAPGDVQMVEATLTRQVPDCLPAA
ncbi:hypothetical protein ACFVZD_36030 [Streptomyces sp. NPDC058287]|uniref:hypothetical protein n=1 Tax=unclassified Streptomyces TaxID=2593676 RepID=UPI0036EADA4B